MRGRDAGGSERHPGMGWIGVAHAPHHSTRKRADFPCGSCITRDLDQPREEAKQMTAIQAGAVSHRAVDWPAINWHKAPTLVRRLQARLVQATQGGRWGKVHGLQRLLT